MRVKSSLINSVLGIVFLIILTILGFISTGLFVTNLGIEYAGLNGLFTNIISILAITELGLGGAITYNLYKPIYDNDLNKINSIMLFYRRCYRIIGILIFSISLFFSLFIQFFVKETTFDFTYIKVVFLLFALNSSISYFLSYNRNIFYASQKNYIVLISDFICKTIKYVLQIIAIVVWKDYVLFLLIQLFFTFVANLIIHLLAKKHFSYLNLDKGKRNKEIESRVFTSIKDLSLIQIMNIGVMSTDNIIISSLINIKSVGLYSNYGLIIRQLFMIINSFFVGIGASIGNLVAENNDSKIKRTFVNLEYLCFFIASFVICSLYYITEPFICLWIGREFLLSTNILIVLIINFYILIQRQPINYFYSASGQFNRFLFPSFVEVVLNLLISIVLSIKIGLIGVFIGTLVSSFVSWILSVIIFHKINKMNYFIYLKRQIFFVIIILFELLILNLIFKIYIPTFLTSQIIYLICICLIVPNMISVLIIFNNSNANYLKELLFKMIKKVVKYES